MNFFCQVLMTRANTQQESVTKFFSKCLPAGSHCRRATRMHRRDSGCHGQLFGRRKQQPA